MTLSARNRFFKAGIAIAALCSLAVAGASFFVLPAYSFMPAQDLLRPQGFFHAFTGRLLENSFYAVHAALSGAVVYALASAAFIYKYFEKTQSPEMFFIALFSVSLSFEAARLVIPLDFVFGVSSFYQFAACRLLLLGRFFGLFSLFMASVCAAGFNAQKPWNIVLAIFFISLIIATGIYIDLQAWGTNLNMAVGFSGLFRAVETAVAGIAVASFFASANIRGSKEYLYAGAGAAFAAMGRSLLLYADNWAGAVLGIVFLAGGTWLVCARLHRVYLWL
ncbi:MAG: hypothetical protein FWG66_09630 [Spirochaetes bacterium]|nr:hypothetical protein [Spirochaetota bacterium]